MAEVAEDERFRERIDDYLDYLIRTWEGIPALAAEWNEWDDLSQSTFVHNWGVPADRMHQLRQWAGQKLMSPAQQARYRELLKLVAKNQPLLEAMLKDNAA